MGGLSEEGEGSGRTATWLIFVGGTTMLVGFLMEMGYLSAYGIPVGLYDWLVVGLGLVIALGGFLLYYMKLRQSP